MKAEGLLTPLLDWTYSAYVALFFAFHKDDSKEEAAKLLVEFAAGDEKKTDLVHFIDFAQPGNNDCLVANQFTSTKQPRRRTRCSRRAATSW